MKTLYEPARQELQLVNVLSALSDPIRLQIVVVLMQKPELSCGEFNLPAAKSTLSHHFRTLREAGITSTRSEGTLHLISLRRDDLEARFPGLLEMLSRATESL